MKRILLRAFCFLVVSVSPLVGFAQWNEALFQNSSKDKYSVGAYVNGDFGSNCITNQFAGNLLFGNYIDDKLKQQVVKNLQPSGNRLGLMLDYGAYIVFHNDTIKKKRIFNIFYALRHKTYFNTTFSPDLFKVAFYGNAMYAGRTADFSSFSLNSLTYQQAEVGFVCTNFGGSAQLGMGISFLSGSQMISINARSASLYTEQTGQYLVFSSDAQFQQSDTAASARRMVNGYGASLDLFFRAPYKIGKKTGNISMSVSGLGFIYWNNKSINYQKDTSYLYSGITINSLTDLQNASFNSLKKDSLQQKYLPFKKTAFYSTIPTLLTVNTNTNMGKWRLELGLNYFFNGNSVGYGYVQGDKPIGKNWSAGIQLGYGGYVTYNSAFIVTRQMPKSSLKICVNHLQGVISNYFGGAGVYAEYSHVL